jgi:hypothetical protein
VCLSQQCRCTSGGVVSEDTPVIKPKKIAKVATIGVPVLVQLKEANIKIINNKVDTVHNLKQKRSANSGSFKVKVVGEAKELGEIEMYRRKMGPLILDHLATRIVWQHRSGCSVVVEANSLLLLSELVPLWIEALSKSDPAGSDIAKLKAQPIGNITSTLAKLIRKQRNMRSLYGWWITNECAT